jgi:hypothetical protein
MRGVLMRNIHLHPDEIAMLPAVCAYRSYREAVPEWRSVLPIIQDVSVEAPVLGYGFSDFRNRHDVGPGTLEETAILSDSFIMSISGQNFERVISENDRIIAGGGVRY